MGGFRWREVLDGTLIWVENLGIMIGILTLKIAELLELEKGEDTIEWFVEGGEVILRKRTKVYHGHNFEQEEIRQRLLDFEEDTVLNGEDLDPEFGTFYF